MGLMLESAWAPVRLMCTSLSAPTVTDRLPPLATCAPSMASRTPDAALGVTVIVSLSVQPTA